MNHQTVQCPYCGEPFEVAIETELIDQNWIEDCPVCCQPILFIMKSEDLEIFLEVRRP
ncbi:MAG: CPXCG motif-containing cysteine-rich protein [Verrucomicrobiota bacterium]